MDDNNTENHSFSTADCLLIAQSLLSNINFLFAIKIFSTSITTTF